MKKLNRFTSALLCSALIICSAASSLSFKSSASNNIIPEPEKGVSWVGLSEDETYIPDVSPKTMKAIKKAENFYGRVDDYTKQRCEIAEKIANGVLKNYTVKEDGSVEYRFMITEIFDESYTFDRLPTKDNLDEMISDILLMDVSHSPSIKLVSYDERTTKVCFRVYGDEYTVRYSLNGKDPTEKSPVYKGGTFTVKGASTIKLRVSRDGYRAAVYSYFIDIDGTIKTAADNYKDNYFYKQLTADQKKYYESCFISNRYGIMTDNPKLSDYDRYRARYAYEADVYHTWVERYRVSGDAKKKAAAAKVYEIVNKALEYKTDYERIKVLHDELCKFANYRYNGNCDGTAGTLFEEGTGICACFARAFATLCTMSGIDCIYISGDVTGDDRGHAWNMVKLDGKWYYVDTTWDEGLNNSVSHQYFLKAEKNMGVTSTSKTQDHFPDFSLLKKYGLKYPTVSEEDYKKTSDITEKKAIYTLLDWYIVMAPDSTLDLDCLADFSKGVTTDFSATFSRENFKYRYRTKMTHDENNKHYFTVGPKASISLSLTSGVDTKKLFFYTTHIGFPTKTLSVKASSKTLSVGDTLTLNAVIDDISDEYVMWSMTQDNFELTYFDQTKQDTKTVKLKAIAKGNTTFYCFTSTGKVTSVTVTVK